MPLTISLTVTIRPENTIKIIKTNSILLQKSIKTGCHQLTNVKSVTNDEVMNAVCGSEVKGKKIERKSPPSVPNLCLLDDLTSFDVTIVMHVRGHNDQTEMSEGVREAERPQIL